MENDFKILVTGNLTVATDIDFDVTSSNVVSRVTPCDKDTYDIVVEGDMQTGYMRLKRGVIHVVGDIFLTGR